MKKLSFMLLCCCYSFAVTAQPDTWTQKNDVGWTAPNGPTDRNLAVGFSIGGKGFVGTGNDGFPSLAVNLRNDFYEFDPVANSWSQKTAFGGDNRYGATAFSIGSKGYIGLGQDSTGYKNDFWQYDSVADTWTQKANFGGGARSQATGFSIGNKGYIGTGQSPALFNDFWQYDPATNAWTQKANFGGDGRIGAVGFSIGGKGFIGTGFDNGARLAAYENDFWEYDTLTDSWTQKAAFGGVGRYGAAGFSIGSKGYIGTGFTAGPGGYLSDFWQYDTAADTWTQKANFAGAGRMWAVGFNAGGMGYIGTGCDMDNYHDFWQYNPTADTWTQKTGFGAGTRTGAIGFSIGTEGYIGLGNAGVARGTDNSFWQYDAATGLWTQKANFAGSARSFSTGFSVGSKGYIGGGGFNEFWQYDPVANTWTQKANFGGGARGGTVGFGIDAKGYLGTGAIGNTLKNDWWEYDTLADTWTKKANFGGLPCVSAVGFSIGSKGYIGTGTDSNSVLSQDFWQYDPTTDTWTKKATFPGGARANAVGFSIDSLGYLGTGRANLIYYSDFWQYNPTANTWTQKADFGDGERTVAVGFSIGHNGYLGTGEADYGGDIELFGRAVAKSDFWQYATTAAVRTTLGDYSVSSNCPALSGIGFNWELDNNSGLVFGIDPNNTNLSATCWGARILSGNYRDTTALFGGSQTQPGAYLPRNYVVIPATEPTAPVRLRLYATVQEVAAFVTYFNGKYGTSYTQNDIRIVRYDGVNQDLDLSNNSTTPTDYTSIAPDTIGSYGSSNEYLYFAFNTTSLSEFAIALTSTPVPLPLQLLDFTAVYANGASLLQWQTAQEQNTAYFNVMRSTDGKTFSMIGTAKAAGNSNTVLNYRFTDNDAGKLNAAVIYYRLQEVDLDNQANYSNIAVVNISNQDKNIFVTPNPATSTINIQWNAVSATAASLMITDATGRMLINQNISVNAGRNSIPLSIAGFSSGVYYIVISSPGTKWRTEFSRL